MLQKRFMCPGRQFQIGKTKNLIRTIISVIELSNLYSISLDDLLKGDRAMMEHLEECTNVVRSTQKLIGAIILNVITVILLVTLSVFLPGKSYYLFVVFCLAIISSSVLLYQIIKRI